MMMQMVGILTSKMMTMVVMLLLLMVIVFQFASLALLALVSAN